MLIFVAAVSMALIVSFLCSIFESVLLSISPARVEGMVSEGRRSGELLRDFKANIDVSHLLLADVGAEEVARLKNRAIHVHISDCDGKVHGDLPPGRGVVDFPPYLKQIADLQIDGTVSIELEYSPDPDRIEEWVREAFDSTAALMKAAGLRE